MKQTKIIFINNNKIFDILILGAILTLLILDKEGWGWLMFLLIIKQ